MSTIVFANQKGGVGKTTTAVNVGAYLGTMGYRVLMVDFDPQGNLTSSFGLDKNLPGSYEAITGQKDIEKLIVHGESKGVSVLPASLDLSAASVELVGLQDRDYRLKKVLSEVKSKYDYVLVDCPPSLGVLTLNGLIAADRVIIPLQTEYFALEGVTQLIKTIRLVQKGHNPQLEIAGIVFTMYDSRTRLAQEVVKDVSGYFGPKVFSTMIHRNVRLSEAPSHGKPIVLFDPYSSGALSYKALAQEVAQRVKI